MKRKAKIEIRECAWIDGKAIMWQGHAYRDGHRMTEPLISGLPAHSPSMAKFQLTQSLGEYMDLSIEGKEAMADFNIPRSITAGYKSARKQRRKSSNK